MLKPYCERRAPLNEIGCIRPYLDPGPGHVFQYRLRSFGELYALSGSYKRPAREDVISVLESYPDPSAQLIVECYKPLYDVAIDY